MNHDLILDRDAFALWESGGLSAHLDFDGRLGAQRGDTLTMHKQRVGPFDSDREKNAPRPDPLTFEVTYVSRVQLHPGHRARRADRRRPRPAPRARAPTRQPVSEEERPVYRPAPWRTRPAPPDPDARRPHGRRASPPRQETP